MVESYKDQLMITEPKRTLYWLIERRSLDQGMGSIENEITRSAFLSHKNLCASVWSFPSGDWLLCGAG